MNNLNDNVIHVSSSQTIAENSPADLIRFPPDGIIRFHSGAGFNPSHSGSAYVPWWQAEFDNAKRLRRIFLYGDHTEEYIVASSEIVISCSDDCKTWKQIWHGSALLCQGGTESLVVDCDNITRFVRIELNGGGGAFLRLSAIKFSGDEWNWSGAAYLASRRTVYSRWNGGFFNCCQFVLTAILDAYRNGVEIDVVDFSQGFNMYKGSAGEDIYPRLFSKREKPRIIAEANDLIGIGFDWTAIYRDLAFNHYSAFISRYFWPSDEVVKKILLFASKYDIEVEKTVAVWYRGTDKSTEAELANPSEYLKLTDRVLEENSEIKTVLIQTDSLHVRSAFLDRYGERCRYIEELPATTKKIGVHALIADSERLIFAQDLLAAVILLSKCRYLINHTGNLAAWMALYRGHAERMFQFSATAQLIEPYDAVSRQ